MKWKIIYFDDDVYNLEVFQEALDDFHIIGSSNPSHYAKLIHDHRPHAYIIDVNMPVMDGFTLYDKIIHDPHYNGCPVFFISGDVTDENKIRSFQNGAVDFFSRDLKPDEISLRLSNKIKVFLQSTNILEVGNLRLDAGSFKASIGKKPIELTMLEFRILNTLCRNYPEAVDRADLVKILWGNEPIKKATIHTHLANLRNKIEDWDHIVKVRDNNVIIAKLLS